MCVCVFGPVLSERVVARGHTRIVVLRSEFSVQEAPEYMGFQSEIVKRIFSSVAVR